MAEKANPDPGSRVPIRVPSGVLTPCYLVIQSTSWCHRFKHPISCTMAWRQCELHWPGWHPERKRDLCPLEEREETAIMIPHAQINDPSRVRPQSECPLCLSMRDDPTLKDLREHKGEFREGSRPPPIALMSDAQRTMALRVIEDKIKDRLDSLAKEHEFRLVQSCKASYTANPPLQIYVGPVFDTEKNLRQQSPFWDESEPVAFLTHPFKRMKD